MKKKSLFVTLISASALLFSCGSKKPETDKTFKVTWDLNSQKIVEEYKEGETPHFDYNKYPLPINNVGDYNEDYTEQLADCFIEWDRPFTPVTEDTTYTAKFGQRSVVTRLVYYPPNGDFTVSFKCERTPTLVNWADGEGSVETPTSNILEHNYKIRGGGGVDRHRFIYIFGDIGSITFYDHDADALIKKGNDYFSSVFLSPYVTSIDTSAYATRSLQSLFIPYSVKNIATKICVGSVPQSIPTIDSFMIFAEADNELSTWEHDWNCATPNEGVKRYFNAIYGISDIGYGRDEANLNNVYMVGKYDGEKHVALVRNFDETGDYKCPSKVTTNFGDMYYTDILFGAFKNSAITKLEFEEDSKVSYIGSDAFSSSQITEFIAPKDLEVISESAFSGAKLETVTLNDTIKELGKGAFTYCKQLLKVTYTSDNGATEKEAHFPNALTAIGNYAFFGCSLLEKFVIPNTVTELGSFSIQCGNPNFTVDMSKYTDPDTIPVVEPNFISLSTTMEVQYDGSNVSVESFKNHRWPTDEAGYHNVTYKDITSSL